MPSKSLVFAPALVALLAGLTAHADPGFDTNMRKLAAECLKPLKQNKASSAAITYFFHNGSRESPVSTHVKRQITTHLLREAGRDIAIIDRQDFRILHLEDSFGFMFSTGDENSSQAVPVDAILVGELITSPAASTMVICLKAIDPKTSRILSAQVVNVKLSQEFASRLGISELDLPVLQPLPEPAAGHEKWAGDLSAAFDPKKVSCSLDDPGVTDAATVLNSRLLRAYLTSSLVSGGWPLLEREMFFLVARDQAAAGKELAGYPPADVILSLQIDDAAPKSQPAGYARAVQRRDGRLLGQSHIALNASAAGGGIAKNVGSDQSLAEALARAQGKLAPGKEDPLVFSASIILPEVMTPSKRTADLIASTKAGDADRFGFPNIIGVTSRGIFASRLGQRSASEVSSNNQRFGLEKNKVIEHTLFNLNAVGGDEIDIGWVRANLLCCLIWGYSLDYEDDDGAKREFIHLGPLLDVAMQISSNYTFNRDGTPNVVYWLDYLGFHGFFRPQGGSDAFLVRLFQALYPRFQDPNRPPLPFPRGSYVGAQNKSHVPVIRFEYEIETVWKETFPSTIKVTIDLTPMKESIYKVKK